MRKPKQRKRRPIKRAIVNRKSKAINLLVRKSPVHGRGVFSLKPVRKGARIIEYTGQRVRWSSIPAEVDDARTYYFGLDNNRDVIDPSVGGNEAQWINHSCDPNCEIRETRGRIFIHALRDIRPGEELSYDYRLEIDDDVPRTKAIEDEAPCFCGSPSCRGTLLAPHRTPNRRKQMTRR